MKQNPNNIPQFRRRRLIDPLTRGLAGSVPQGFGMSLYAIFSYFLIKKKQKRGSRKPSRVGKNNLNYYKMKTQKMPVFLFFAFLFATFSSQAQDFNMERTEFINAWEVAYDLSGAKALAALYSGKMDMVSAEDGNIKSSCLAQKMYDKGKLVAEYRYNAAGYAQEVKEYKNDKVKWHRIAERTDAEGRVLEARIIDSIEKKQFTTKLSRDAAGFVQVVESFQVVDGAAPVLQSRSVYENNPTSPSVITKISRYDGSGNLTSVAKIENLDANGSSKSVVTDKDGKLKQTEKWTRDDKNSPRQAIEAFPYQWQHNRVEYTVTKADGTIDESSRKWENIVYNAQGYPTSVTVRRADGSASNLTWEYICQ